MLYLPRGTVHQAVAQTEDSSHLTLSTYQRWTLGTQNLGFAVRVFIGVGDWKVRIVRAASVCGSEWRGHHE